MSKAWFIGDSFTSGYGIGTGSIYTREFGPGKTFDQIIGEQLKAETSNLGIPGCSNYTIIKILTQHLTEFTAGDYVIVGNTSPLRGLVPNKNGSELIDQKLFDSTPYPESIAYKNDELEQILRQYSIEFQKDFIPLWNGYTNSIILNILRYISKQNITGILWDYSVWSEEIVEGMAFENISMATQNKIDDLHWSYKGHSQAASWILDGINRKVKFLTYY